jgi:hypothetical protein
MQKLWIAAVLLTVVSGLASRPAQAQFSIEQRKELADLGKQVSQVPTLIRKKEFDEAEKVLSAAETALEALKTSPNANPNDPLLRRAVLLVTKQRAALNKATGTERPAAAEVSFVKDVAPIINQRCLGCHGADNPRRNLRLDQFFGWRRGGRSGQLLIPGNAARSLIITRIKAPENEGRMPQRGDPLSKEQIDTISDWINQGAKFDGAGEAMSLADLIYEEDKKNVKVLRAKGTEQVKFTRDIAPWMAKLCLGCHNENRRSGGLSVVSYFDIMKGGESGEVIIPGNMEESRLFRLTGGLELPRMPANNQLRLTRQNYEDLKTWFREGNVFDGQDPRTPIESYVPDPGMQAASKTAGLSDTAMQGLREGRTQEQFRTAFGESPPPFLKSEDFLITGNVDAGRLRQVQSWASSALTDVQKKLAGPAHPWRGRLAVFVLKDRDSYEEFTRRVEDRKASSELFGHARVTGGQEDAYLVLLDQGDQPANGLGLRVNLVEQIGGAYVMRGGRPLPNWAVRGTGLWLAEDQLNPAQQQEFLRVAAMLAPAVASPDDVFEETSFSPGTGVAVGYALVKFLLANGGPDRFQKFLNAMESGSSVTDALKSEYDEDSSTVANAFFAGLKKR